MRRREESGEELLTVAVRLPERQVVLIEKYARKLFITKSELLRRLIDIAMPLFTSKIEQIEPKLKDIELIDEYINKHVDKTWKEKIEELRKDLYRIARYIDKYGIDRHISERLNELTKTVEQLSKDAQDELQPFFRMLVDFAKSKGWSESQS